MSGRLLVVANGAPPPKAFLRRAARGAAAVICADGGYAAAEAAGLKVHLIAGDLDSLPKGARLHAGIRIALDDDPNSSDLEKALRFAATSRFARRFGAAEVWVLGALGGRLDQLLSNLQIVQRYASILRVRVVDPAGTAEIVQGRFAFDAAKNETISIFPLGEARVRAKGLKYPLKGELLAGGSQGLSNAAAARRVTLNVLGRVWLVRSSPPW